MPHDRRVSLIASFGLCVLAVVARVAFLRLTGAYGQVINDDGYSYNQIAANLLAGYGFAWEPGQPTAFRLFGYPWLLAAIYRVGGISPATLQWVQVILGALLVVPTYALARRLGSTAVALLAGLGVALHPVLIYLTVLTAPEVVTILCQIGMVWYAWLIASGRSRTWPAALALTLAGALGVLFRPESLLIIWLFPLAAALALGLCSREVRTLLVTAALATVLAVALPVARNWAVFNTFIPFPTIGGVTFWGGNNPHANGGWLMPAPQYWPDAEPPPLGMQGWPGLSESQSQASFYRASFEWMRSDPVAALRLIPQKLLRSWTFTFADETRSRVLPPVIDWLNALFGLVTLLGIAFALCRHERILVAILFVPVVAWLAKTVIFYGSARQTAAAVPFVCIFAALALVKLTERLRAKLGSRPSSR